MTRTLTAMFRTQAEAERAGQMLASQLRLAPSAIRVSPGAGATDAGYDKSAPYAEKGFFGSIKDMLLPEEDRYAYAEGMRRGNILLNATVDEGQITQASSVLEQSGALDLDAQEASWKQSGWTGYDAAAHTAARPAAPAATSGRQDDTIKVVEERLVVGKRAVEAGGVRVRAYVIERPVEAQVKLREERVTVERHPVNQPATAADAAAFADKTLEARATREEAVVGKEVRIVEEIALKKEAADRTETVRDSVRKTEVDVEDAAATARAAGTATVKGGTGAGVAGAVDKTLGTNLSGANPARK